MSTTAPVDTAPTASARQFGLLLSVAEVAEALSLSRRTVYRLIDSEPDFPRPRRIGNVKRWPLAEIQHYVEGLPHAAAG